MKSYPSFTYQFVMDELPMDQGWAFYNWAIENDGWLQFGGLKRGGKGYIAQQADRLMEMIDG